MKPLNLGRIIEALFLMFENAEIYLFLSALNTPIGYFSISGGLIPPSPSPIGGIGRFPGMGPGGF